jgi:hypothetical protein
MRRKREEHAPNSCPPGTILRSAYLQLSRKTRKRRFVKARCIRDVGNPGKGFQGLGPGIGPLRKGDLSKFGYDHVVSMSALKRKIALAKAVRAYGSLTVWRKLNALYVYTKNTAPESSALFDEDRNWIKEHYGISK